MKKGQKKSKPFSWLRLLGVNLLIINKLAFCHAKKSEPEKYNKKHNSHFHIQPPM